jgi:signal transduction histidine kinase
MKRTLYLKFLFCYALFGALAILILCTFTQNAINRNMERREAQKLYRESAQIASDYASNYLNSSLSLEDFQSHMEIIGGYLSSEIWIIDNQGNLLFDSADADIGQRAAHSHYTVLNGFDSSYFGNQYYQVGDFYGTFDEDTLTVFSPVTSNYRVRSYVLIHKPISAITDWANDYMNIAFYTVVLIYLVALVFLVLFTFGVYRPIRQTTRVAQSYAQGDFKPQNHIRSNDEIGYLANTMNYMAKELDTLEEDQRKFISNVSHDFRSPLTSIKGYVEAMLDGTIPVEMQSKYLNIILFETERLTKLTQGILDLNRYGHRGIILDLADFDINRMIKTTILTFEGTCEKKGLSFDLVLTGQELFVNGDMSKIQQVLYNLIDNATKFSHNDSAIKIETSIKNEKVLISVKDSGIGIPADSIKKIWDRFYKTDLSRGKDKKGTGLGLSIVKEIIQAHKEHINVISTEGVGTEFIFTLPLASKEVEE